jgi:hypothetical protein
MTIASLNTSKADPKLASIATLAELKPRIWVAWSSFFFALLQSVCTFFAAVDGLRLLIGIGAFAISASVGSALDHIHADWIRLPMIVLALAGALFNLVILWQVRRLRHRPSTAWRFVPPSHKKVRMERLQFVLSALSLLLITLEEVLHLRWASRL